MNGNLYSNEQHIAIIAALRKAVDACKHHKAFGQGGLFKRALTPLLEADEITSLFGGNTPTALVSCDRVEISVWMKLPNRGVTSVSLVRLYGGSRFDYNRDHFWVESIISEIDRNDLSDYRERREQENSAEVQQGLRALNEKAEALAAQLEELRSAAKAAVKGLPIPASAKLRSKQIFWDAPSPDLVAQFPALFPKERGN